MLLPCLQEELIALQPQLEESTRQTEAAMEVIAKETEEADKVKKVGPCWVLPCSTVPHSTDPAICPGISGGTAAVGRLSKHALTMDDHHMLMPSCKKRDQYALCTRCGVDKACMA